MNTSKGRVQSAHEPRYQERPTAADSAVGTEVACPYCMVEVRTRLAEAEALLRDAQTYAIDIQDFVLESGYKAAAVECADRIDAYLSRKEQP